MGGGHDDSSQAYAYAPEVVSGSNITTHKHAGSTNLCPIEEQNYRVTQKNGNF